jgi:predicted PurR-regulated permease PerM
MNEVVIFPFYAKVALILTAIVLVLTILFLGQHILIPIFMALLFGILLSPFVRFLNDRIKLPNVISSSIAVVLFTIIIAIIIIIVSIQIGNFSSEIKNIKTNIAIHYHTIQIWIKNSFNISYHDQNEYIQDVRSNSLSSENILSENTLTSVTDVLLNFLLVPLYTFLFLLYKNLCLQFLYKLVKKNRYEKLTDILLNIKLSVQSYLVGLIIEMVIVSSLTSIGFMIIGLQYAVLLGVITGILNLIPYVGILVAGLLSIIASLSGTAHVNIVAGVIIVNLIVQLIDNNVLVPLVVSSKVKINAIASIVGIIVGSSIAGVAGMFLAIPIIAILKVIFDRIDALTPFGLLLGDTLPKVSKYALIKKVKHSP